MTKEIEKDGVCLFICQLCKFAYRDKNMADLCEEWCKKHNSCNLEITKHGEQLEDKSGD